MRIVALVTGPAEGDHPKTGIWLCANLPLQLTRTKLFIGLKVYSRIF